MSDFLYFSLLLFHSLHTHPQATCALLGIVKCIIWHLAYLLYSRPPCTERPTQKTKTNKVQQNAQPSTVNNFIVVEASTWKKTSNNPSTVFPWGNYD